MKAEKECQCCEEQKQIEEKLCVCEDCMKTDRGKMIAIKEFLYENPEATIGELCEQLGISHTDMNRLIEEGRVTVKPRDRSSYETEFQKIKTCIALHPEYVKYQVSATTGVPIKIIDELVDIGRLIEVGGTELRVNRKLDKMSKEKDEKKDEKKQKDIREVYKIGILAGPIQTRMPGKSKLVEDLENKKKGIDVTR